MDRKLLKNFFSVIVLLAALTRGPNTFAQSGGTSLPDQYGAFLGNLLPDGPEGNKEILGVWGGRYALQSSETMAYEFGGLFGAQAPVTWQNFFANARHDIPVQGFMAHVGAGGDIIRMTTKLARYDDNGFPILDYAGNQDYTHVKRIMLGLHILGGAKAHLMGPFWGRADMKLNFVPALILTITVGIELR